MAVSLAVAHGGGAGAHGSQERSNEANEVTGKEKYWLPFSSLASLLRFEIRGLRPLRGLAALHVNNERCCDTSRFCSSTDGIVASTRDSTMSAPSSTPVAARYAWM